MASWWFVSPDGSANNDGKQAFALDLSPGATWNRYDETGKMGTLSKTGIHQGRQVGEILFMTSQSPTPKSAWYIIDSIWNNGLGLKWWAGNPFTEEWRYDVLSSTGPKSNVLQAPQLAADGDVIVVLNSAEVWPQTNGRSSGLWWWWN